MPICPCCVAARRRFANKDPLLGSGADNVLAAPAGGALTVSDIAADWSEIYPLKDREPSAFASLT